MWSIESIASARVVRYRNCPSGRTRKRLLRGITAICVVCCTSSAQQATSFRPVIPKVWDETALAGWATPVAALNVRPTHISAAEYYSVPEYSLRSYPVYMPGREPDGYWEMLQHIGPKPLIEPEILKTKADWIHAGQRVFDEASTLPLTIFDRQVTAKLRSREFLEEQRAAPLPDGTLGTLRWVPTKQGVALSTLLCGGCHIWFRSDGVRIPGASARTEASRMHPFKAVGVRSDFLEAQNRVMRGAAPFYMGPGPLARLSAI
jgi:hypothetical protein